MNGFSPKVAPLYLHTPNAIVTTSRCFDPYNLSTSLGLALAITILAP